MLLASGLAFRRQYEMYTSVRRSAGGGLFAALAFLDGILDHSQHLFVDLLRVQDWVSNPAEVTLSAKLPEAVSWLHGFSPLRSTAR